MIFKWIICGLKGHEPDPDDDLVRGIMHDGAISGLTISMPERDAKQTAEELRIETELIRKYAYGTRKEEK